MHQEEMEQLKIKKEPKEIKPSAARLIESLRDTGYTFSTAVADIVDNSVAADATEIRLRLELEFDNSPVLMIADNGNGMTEKALEDAMMYGSPLRPSPKSLGKFGMGLKTASTSFCRKLTVISSKDGVYNIRQWDLDVVADTDKWVLLEPELDEYAEQIEFLEEVKGASNGTLVIWENIDRLVRTNTEGTARIQIEKLAKELEVHLSGVFYNFLTKENTLPDLNIRINNSQLTPWDPFCRWLNKDGVARVEIHKNKPFTFTREVAGIEEVIGTFYVNVYILPNKNDLTEDELRDMRYGLDNQGFHVFREDRMIFSGGWPNRLFVKEPHMNLIRVELLFDHKLDDYFQIDIKKSRIDLPKEIRDTLKKVITPARNEANRRYRTGSRKDSGKGGTVLSDQHGKSSNAINKHHDETTAGSQIGSVDKAKGEADVKNKFGTTRVKLKFDDNVNRLVQASESLQDGVLWTPGLANGNKHAVFLNESHEFYKKFYVANRDNAALVLAMDSLFWSLAEAELSVLSDSVRRNIEDLRINVSRSLRILAEELPEIEDPEESDDE